MAAIHKRYDPRFVARRGSRPSPTLPPPSGYSGRSAICLQPQSVGVRSWLAQFYLDMLSLSSQAVSATAVRHTRPVPRIWTDTIEAHRNAVREATLNAAATLVAEHGLQSVTMSEIAKRTGIGRATL